MYPAFKDRPIAIRGILQTIAIGVTAVPVNGPGFLSEECQKNWVWDEKLQSMGTYCFDHVCNRNQYTKIHLNKCLGNHNGRLIAQANGGALETCQTCHISDDWYKFICHCKDSDGTLVWTEIEMNKVMHNWFGWLTCFGEYETDFPHDYPCNGNDWHPDPNSSDETCINGCAEIFPPPSRKPEPEQIQG